MLLTQYIDKKLHEAHGNSHVADNYVGIRNSIIAFLGDEAERFELVQLALPGWIERYYTFMLDSYESRKGRLSEKSARRYLTMLRVLVRHAVEERLFPDIDIFPADDASTKRRGVATKPIADDIHRVAVSKRLKAMAPVSAYLLGINCAGMEPQTLQSLTADDFDKEGKRLYLPHLRVWAPLPASLMPPIERVVAANEARADRQSTAKKGTLNTEKGSNTDRGTNTEKGTTAEIDFLYGQLAPYGLVNDRSVFTDWLCLIAEKGVSAESVGEIIAARYDLEQQPSDSLGETIGRIVEAIVADKAVSLPERTRRRWYALKSYGRSGKEVASEIAVIKQSGAPIAISESDIYLPFTGAIHTGATGRKTVKSPAAVMRDLLFFKASQDDVATLARELPAVWVFSESTPSGRRFIPIPASEIYHLQRVISYLTGRDDVDAELLNEAEVSRRFTHTTLAAGTRVTINIPGYEAYEAIVVKLDKSHSTATSNIAASPSPTPSASPHSASGAATTTATSASQTSQSTSSDPASGNATADALGLAHASHSTSTSPAPTSSPSTSPTPAPSTSTSPEEEVYIISLSAISMTLLLRFPRALLTPALPA